MDYLGSVHVPDLPQLTMLMVETKNSSYRIVVIEGSDVCIQGGTHFPEPTSARLDGATMEGNALLPGWIEVGLPMQITAGAKRVVTSSIREITTVRFSHRVIA
jgi:hypothetical protein